MMRTAVLICLATLALATGACKDKKAAQGEAAPSGEVLPGAASDAMLPYDTVRSQPPLAPQTEAAAKSGAKGAASDAAEAAAAASDAATPVADAKPAPEASAGAAAQ
jgi:hypothetical protein